MAYQITAECRLCFLCLGVCPNQAIRTTPAVAIDPLLCTECLGYADVSQCADVCPEDAILPAISSA